VGSIRESHDSSWVNENRKAPGFLLGRKISLIFGVEKGEREGKD